MSNEIKAARRVMGKIVPFFGRHLSDDLRFFAGLGVVLTGALLLLADVGRLAGVLV